MEVVVPLTCLSPVAGVCERREENVRSNILSMAVDVPSVIIMIVYIYHALINALSAHMIHINLYTIFYTHAEHSPTKTIYIKYKK